MLADGYSKVAPGKLVAAVTCLEMLSPAPTGNAADPEGLTLTLVREPDLDWYRDLYRRIGTDWLWSSRLSLAEGETLVATAGDNVPPSDVGKTVYKIDILADGTRVDQRAGCGHTGDSVTLYFPVLRRFATPNLTFHQGGERVDVTLAGTLPYRLISPGVSKD